MAKEVSIQSLSWSRGSSRTAILGTLLAVPLTAAASGVVDELRERYSPASPEDS
ncbi:hypothetical protein ABZ235_08945 [Streptomyces canus]|uniref:hypothetical protein n=1 Tax=Streptomyces sp. 12257 TaxID=3041009 RepID=UPI00131B4365|nr:MULTISPECIES: hypothetical protein [Streptomyces]MDI5912761.1 hypothetical protein [Streptomyces sp. 12257]